MVKKSLTTFILLLLTFSVTWAQDTAATDSTVSISQADADSTQDSQDLKKFRKLFDEIVETEKTATSQQKDSVQQDPALQLGGFVLDETRSKMGRNFYELFYQNWEAPENAGNYTLTITEQPSIGRGTMVTIKIDYERVFNARLQPRYNYIEAVSEQAVARAQEIMKEKVSVKEQLTGY